MLLARHRYARQSARNPELIEEVSTSETLTQDEVSKYLNAAEEAVSVAKSNKAKKPTAPAAPAATAAAAAVKAAPVIAADTLK